MDGDPGHANLLKYALNETNYMHTLVILTVSMTTPWSWKEQLDHWIKILNEHVHNLNIDPGMVNDNHKVDFLINYLFNFLSEWQKLKTKPKID